MDRHSFSVIISEKSLESTSIVIGAVTTDGTSSSSVQRFSVWQQTSPIRPDTCSCSSHGNLGVATVIKVTNTNDNIVSIGEWNVLLSLGSVPVKGLGAGLLALNFAAQNYNFGSGAKNQIIWSTDNTTTDVTNGVFYGSPTVTNIPPTLFAQNGSCASIVGSVVGQGSAGPYLNASGVAKLTYYFKSCCNYDAGDIVIDIDLELSH